MTNTELGWTIEDTKESRRLANNIEDFIEEHYSDETLAVQTHAVIRMLASRLVLAGMTGKDIEMNSIKDVMKEIIEKQVVFVRAQIEAKTATKQ